MLFKESILLNQEEDLDNGSSDKLEKDKFRSQNWEEFVNMDLEVF